MTTDFNETPGASRFSKPSGGGSGSFLNKPFVKLGAVIFLVGAVAYGANTYYQSTQAVEDSVLPTAQVDAAEVSASPDTVITPEYQRAVREQSNQRIEQAEGQLSSAIPTPIQSQVMAPVMGRVEGESASEDALAEFERSVQGRQVDTSMGMAAPPPPIQVASPEAVANLAKAYQAQITAMAGDWDPEPMNVFESSYVPDEAASALTVDSADSGNSTSSNSSSPSQPKVYIPLGAVHYGQMLMEANSDIPGPIMAEMLSGPFAGGRLIGAFETQREFLTIRFTKLSFRRMEINVDIMAINPSNTLGGVVTEVDPRYFTRVILPAAGEFIRSFGETLSKDESSVSVTGSGSTSITTSSTQEPTTKDALYDGLEASADRVGQFLEEEAGQTKRLVRVAVGTPIGLFFLKSVSSRDVQ